MNAAVVQDGSIHPGGAVDVVLETARALDADVVVGFSGVPASWWRERTPADVRVLTRRENKSTLKDAHVAWKILNLDLSEYGVVVTSGPSAKFYQPYDGQRRYHYMHHPPLSSLWFSGGAFDYALRVIDRIETWSIPTVIANSDLTASRIESHYNRTAGAVVNPPVEVERFSPDRERRPDEVVMVGRLEDRKRPELAVEAFRRLQDRDPTPQLQLVGEGPLRDRIERKAPDNVHVNGFVEDDRLVELVERASAGLFLAKREDFGITPIEYMAAGTPVVGVDEPNTNNQVTDGENGLLVDPAVESVRDGVAAALSTEWDREMIRENAEQYGADRFREQITEVVT